MKPLLGKGGNMERGDMEKDDTGKVSRHQITRSLGHKLGSLDPVLRATGDDKGV